MGRRSALALRAFEAVTAYLRGTGWYQDGDDPGIWRLADVTEQDEEVGLTAGIGVGIGSALEIQWDRDWFSHRDIVP